MLVTYIMLLYLNAVSSHEKESPMAECVKLNKKLQLQAKLDLQVAKAQARDAARGVCRLRRNEITVAQDGDCRDLFLSLPMLTSDRKHELHVLPLNPAAPEELLKEVFKITTNHPRYAPPARSPKVKLRSYEVQNVHNGL